MNTACCSMFPNGKGWCSPVHRWNILRPMYVQQLPSVAKQTDVVAEPSVVQPVQEKESAIVSVEPQSSNPAALLPVVWFIGVLLFAAYSGWRWYGLRQRVATATRVTDNIYESDHVVSPFVMGLLR